MPASGAKVGEVNINPESKPARPDDEDLEDDEREMLAEAKARLANTQGKKAKRKARERMLEESKRIALLQKRRELKAAGINVSLVSRKARKEFDYNGDIIHEHKPQAGLYDVLEESQQNEQDKTKFTREVSKHGMSMTEVEEKHRKDQKKQKEQETVRAKQEAKLGIEGAAEAYNQLEQENMKKRKLQLPEPSSSDFKRRDVAEDVDQRILNQTRELIVRQAVKSTLLDDGSSVRNKDTVETRSESAPIKKKSLLKMVKAKFRTLPQPSAQNAVVIPNYEPDEESISLQTDQSWNAIDKGERLRNLEILRQINDEKAKLKRSICVQKGLSIPHPRQLEQLKVPSNELGKLIHKELVGLVRSDYRKYRDEAFQAQLVEDLDDELYDKVNQEIDAIKTHSTEYIPKPFKLAESFDVAETAIGILHAKHKSSINTTNKLQQIIGQAEYEQKRDGLLDQINVLFNQLGQAEIDIVNQQYLDQLDKTAIEVRSKKLQLMVDRLIKTEHDIQDRIRKARLAKV